MSMKRKADDDVAMEVSQDESLSPPLTKHHTQMMEASSSGNTSQVLSLLQLAAADDSSIGIGNQKHLLAAQQDPESGLSPLMLAAQNGHLDICRILLDAGAPWNALDRYGKCAGNWAQENEHWEVVNLLVEEGTKAEVCFAFWLMHSTCYAYRFTLLNLILTQYIMPPVDSWCINSSCKRTRSKHQTGSNTKQRKRKQQQCTRRSRTMHKARLSRT